MRCRPWPRVTGSALGLFLPLVFAFIPPADKALPSLYVAALKTTSDTRLLAPCSTVNRRNPRPIALPGPELLPQALTPSKGIVAGADLKAVIEAELRKGKRYNIVASLEQADFVLVVENTYGSVLAANAAPPAPPDLDRPPTAPGLYVAYLADEPLNLLSSVFAFVTPHTAIAQGVNYEALLGAAVWQGEAHGVNAGPASLRALLQRLRQDFRGSPKPGLARITGENNPDSSRHDEGDALCAIPQPPLAGPIDATAAAPMTAPELPTSAGPPGARPSVAAASGGARFRTGIVSVLVPVTVQDAQGTHVRGLQPSDFHLYEGDVGQHVEGLVPESDPVNIAFVLDTSGSMRPHLESLKAAVSAFIDALDPRDAIMVVSFDGRVYLASDLSRSHEAARRALVQVGPVGYNTRLYDALVATAERFDAVPGRKAIVLLTDGLDVGSMATEAAGAREKIEASNIPVYAVQFDTSHDNRLTAIGVKPAVVPRGLLDPGARFAEATRELEALGSASGGRIEPAVTVERVVEGFQRIGEDLRRQYVLYYYPSNQSRDGVYRRIRVTVDREGVTVRARAGYRLGPPAGSGK